MPTFHGKTIDNKPAANWQAIYQACVKYPDFLIDIRKYDAAKEISIQQMKYWHPVPVKIFAEHTGYSLWKSEQWLKRERGSHWFVHEVEEEENRRGQIMFECLNPACRNLMLCPAKLRGKYVCRECRSPVRMFFMLSKTELSVNDFNSFLENTWEFMEEINCPCPKPDPNWRINQRQSNQKGKTCA